MLRQIFSNYWLAIIAATLLFTQSAVLRAEAEYIRLPANTSHKQALQLRLQKLEELLAQAGDYQRYILLDTAAKTALELKQYERANDYARRLISLAPQFPDDWNYAQAVHQANIILGRAALRADDIDSAKAYLLAASKIPYSEILDAQGADLQLANALLARGQRETVAQYLQAGTRFWPRGRAQLDGWLQQLAAGQIPSLLMPAKTN